MSFIILADAHFSHDTPLNSVVDLSFACSAPVGESGSASPNRRASEVRCKTPEIDLGGPPAVDLNVPVVRQNSVRLQNQQDTVRLRNIATFGSEDTGSLSFLVRTGRGQAHRWLVVTQNACYTYFT